MAAWLVITARGVTTNKGHPLRHNGMARLVSGGQLLVWTVVMVRLAKPVGVAHRGMPMECVEVMLLCSGLSRWRRYAGYCRPDCGGDSVC